MNKNLFAGGQHVFGFTLKQAFSRSFLIVTMALAAGLFLIGAGMNVLMAGIQKKQDAVSNVEKVYVIDESGLSIVHWNKEELRNPEMFPKAVFTKSQKNVETLAKELEKDGSGDVILKVENKGDYYTVTVYLPSGSGLGKNDAEKLGDAVLPLIRRGILNDSGVSGEQLQYIVSDVDTDFMKAGEGEKNDAERMLVLILPMFVTFALYFMVLAYGQSMGNIVSIEKSSKLMETMLVMTRPYGIILGKILATALVEICQVFFWVCSAAAGFAVGNLVAENVIYPGYENYAVKLFEVIMEGGSGAFSVPAILLALAAVCVAFLFYCVLAGLVASFASKAEELSQVMAFYMIFMVIGFMGAYILPMTAKGGVLVLLRIFPLTGAFMLPGEMLVGSVSLGQGIFYLLLLAAFTLAAAVLAGVVYKNQLFYRGRNILTVLMRGKKKEEPEQEWQIVREESQAEILNKPGRVWYFLLTLLAVLLFFALAMGISMLVMNIGARISFGGVDLGTTNPREIVERYARLITDISPVALFFTHIACITVFGIWYYAAYAKPISNLKKSVLVINVRTAALFAVTGIMLCLFANGTVVLESYLIPSVVEDYGEMAQGVGFGVSPFAFFAAVCLAPVGEEFICRGLCLRYGKRAFGNFWIANFLQALLFGIMHGNWVQGIYAFFIGLVLGVIVERYQTLLPAMLIHFIVNASSSSWIPKLLEGIELQMVHGILLVTVPAVVITGLLAVIRRSGEKGGEA